MYRIHELAHSLDVSGIFPGPIFLERGPYDDAISPLEKGSYVFGVGAAANKYRPFREPLGFADFRHIWR